MIVLLPRATAARMTRRERVRRRCMRAYAFNAGTGGAPPAGSSGGWGSLAPGPTLRFLPITEFCGKPEIRSRPARGFGAVCGRDQQSIIAITLEEIPRP